MTRQEVRSIQESITLFAMLFFITSTTRVQRCVRMDKWIDGWIDGWRDGWMSLSDVRARV